MGKTNTKTKKNSFKNKSSKQNDTQRDCEKRFNFCFTIINTYCKKEQKKFL